MKLITKAPGRQRRLIEILRVINESDKPIGARAISDMLSERGYEIGERAVRYNLKILDELGFTRKHGYTGREVTPVGLRELSDALVNDRVGFVNTRIEEYMYRTTFDALGGGDVVVNTSFLAKADFDLAADQLIAAAASGYSLTSRALVADEGEELGSMIVPEGCVGVATLCSITVDGMLLKSGIPVNTTYAGVLEVEEGSFTRFTDLIAYAGTSIDPMKAFMARRMGRVRDAIITGSGRVLANVREIPQSAVEQAEIVISRARACGITGYIKVGAPERSLAACPVGSSKVGVVVCAGVNGPMAAEEVGMRMVTRPISSLLEYRRMKEIR
ncbi:MAG: Ribonuclease R winged-helix domain protein [Methanosaeta sp. PtaB.Bin039]|nr:MAG: Ribonuclease R winged-helix domain protein [Methanosaeta sp. PtaB.Bin039]HOT07346.1 NrpR regulatory domain-containing protein [Methanotrichaceae archaeon]HQF17334.1 NrpR regulatory domain-containing protein [Methanotrichaceae archaeon]HQI91920.1 NrpR regulatory domain-containing protein [Methanotrichaceae archaeon]HQJ29245.1 NrpR regulatory domain-containing protein [Methanotrichaceae archaeon]